MANKFFANGALKAIATGCVETGRKGLRKWREVQDLLLEIAAIDEWEDAENGLH